MNLKDALSTLGKVDGAIAAAALVTAGVQGYPPAVTKVALLVVGITGGVGAILTAIARLVGAPDPVPKVPPAPPPAT